MADSSYYYDNYKEYKKLASDYGKNISSLQSIKDNLARNFYDEQNNVNKELGDLKEDLEKSVRYDSSFNQLIGDLDDFEEINTETDGDLSKTLTNLGEEITSLGNKKTSAENSRDYYYGEYEKKKAEERQKWLDSLKFW